MLWVMKFDTCCFPQSPPFRYAASYILFKSKRGINSWMFILTQNFATLYCAYITSEKWSYGEMVINVYLHRLSSTRHSTGIIKVFRLTGGNWQKWKRVFLTCHCHKIYRDEAVGLKSCKNTWKITIFVKMWNLGQYR